MATTPNLVLAPGTTSRCNAFLQHPFEEVHWGALLAGLVNETLRVEWPADMDPLLRKTGEACTHTSTRQGGPIHSFSARWGAMTTACMPWSICKA